MLIAYWITIVKLTKNITCCQIKYRSSEIAIGICFIKNEIGKILRIVKSDWNHYSICVLQLPRNHLRLNLKSCKYQEQNQQGFYFFFHNEHLQFEWNTFFNHLHEKWFRNGWVAEEFISAKIKAGNGRNYSVKKLSDTFKQKTQLDITRPLLFVLKVFLFHPNIK